MADAGLGVPFRRGTSFSLSVISTSLAKLSCEVAEISEKHEKEFAALCEQNRHLVAKLRTPTACSDDKFAVCTTAKNSTMRETGEMHESLNSTVSSATRKRESAMILTQGCDLSVKANVFREWKEMAYLSKESKIASLGRAGNLATALKQKGPMESTCDSAPLLISRSDIEYTDIPTETPVEQIEEIKSEVALQTRCMMGVTKQSQKLHSTETKRTLNYGQAEFIAYEPDKKFGLHSSMITDTAPQISKFFPGADLQDQSPTGYNIDPMASSLRICRPSGDLHRSGSGPSSDQYWAVAESYDSARGYTKLSARENVPRIPGTLPHFTVSKNFTTGDHHDYGNCPTQDLGSLCGIPSATEGETPKKAMISCQFPFPPTSGFKLGWEFFGVLLLLYDMVTIPMQVFDIPANIFGWVMSWLILVYWCLDLLLSFFSGYYTPEGELVMEFKTIAKHYVSTWFLPDLGIISVDLVSLIINLIVYGSRTFEFGVKEDEQQSSLGIMRIGKALRVLRLVRLVRIMKLSQGNFMEILQEKIMSEFVFALCNIWNNMMVLVFICHGCACIFYLVGTQNFRGYSNWTTTYGYDKLGWFDCYLTSAHWALAIFANGEIIIDPQSIPERLISIVVLLWSMMFFSAFLGIVGNIVQQLLRRNSQKRSEQWILRVYLKQIGISWDLKMRVKRYINVLMASHSNQVSKADVSYINMLSKPLQMELQTEQYLTHFTVHPFFNLLSKRSFNVIRDLCCSAVKEARLSQRDTLFSAGEAVDTMYFVYRGSLTYMQSMYNGAGMTSQLAATGNGYLNSNAKAANIKLGCNDWFCEAAVWTERWLTCGTVFAESDSELVGIVGEQFLMSLSRFQVNMQFPREYAVAFVNALNNSIESKGAVALTDVPERFAELDRLLATYGGRQAHAARTSAKVAGALSLPHGGVLAPMSQFRAVLNDWKGRAAGTPPQLGSLPSRMSTLEEED